MGSMLGATSVVSSASPSDEVNKPTLKVTVASKREGVKRVGVIKVSGKCLDWLKQCIKAWFISIRCSLKTLIIDVRGGRA